MSLLLVVVLVVAFVCVALISESRAVRRRLWRWGGGHEPWGHVGTSPGGDDGSSGCGDGGGGGGGGGDGGGGGG